MLNSSIAMISETNNWQILLLLHKMPLLQITSSLAQVGQLLTLFLKILQWVVIQSDQSENAV